MRLTNSGSVFVFFRHPVFRFLHRRRVNLSFSTVFGASIYDDSHMATVYDTERAVGRVVAVTEYSTDPWPMGRSSPGYHRIAWDRRVGHIHNASRRASR